MTETSIEEQNRRAFNLREVVDVYVESRDLMPAELHLFGRHLEQGMALLDLGVGGGRTTPYLSALAGRYVAMDYSEKMVASCRGRFPDAEILEGDAADLSRFADNTFDAVVFSFNGADYHPDDQRHRFLSECSRVLRPGGRLVLSRHNARALIIVPLPQGRGLSNLARRAKYGLTENAFRLITVPLTRAFWRGEGYVTERGPVPLVLHAATRRRVVAEAHSYGFDLTEVVGSNHPRRLGTTLTPWWYYAFTRR